MNTQQGIPVLRKDAMVPLEIGSGYVKRLYELSMFIIADKTPDELEALRVAFENDTVDNEPWMKSYVTVVNLIKGIEEQAIAHNLVDYRDPNELDN